ncbi:hypothetical protein [Pedobacter sp. KBW06]|uniref:hypothetical protein n=1 Tax=Pedobacter sp. KBW06 TaxID=2153359 RepID=UPI000F590071|nr:hypothetical protein [Pedobacter sp. KBW06]
MIEFITSCIIVLSLITMYLSFHAGKANAFDKMVNVGIAVILFHGIFVLICELFFPLQRYIDAAAPFGLLYGPLCYFSFYALSGKLPDRNRLFLHLMPVIVGIGFYLMILWSSSFRDAYYLLIIRVLYICVEISMISYTGLLLFYNGGDEKERTQEGKKMLITVLVLVFMVAVMFITLSYASNLSKRKVSWLLPRMIIYFAMFTVMIFAFRYQAARILKKTQA